MGKPKKNKSTKLTVKQKQDIKNLIFLEDIKKWLSENDPKL